MVAATPSTENLGQSATDALPQPGTELLQKSSTTAENRLVTSNLKTQVAEPSEPSAPPLPAGKTTAEENKLQPRTTKFVPDEKPEEIIEQKPADPLKTNLDPLKTNLDPLITHPYIGTEGLDKMEPTLQKKAGPETPKQKKADKKSKVESASKAAPAIAPPPISAPVKPAEAATAKSRTPLLIGIGGLLVVLAALGAWMLGSGDEKTETPPNTNVTSQAASTGGDSSTASSQYPQQTAPEGMVYVIGGVLRVGRDDGEENEKPAHVVNLKPFYIDRTEVTNEQYQKFIDAAGHPAPPSWNGSRFPAGSEQLPVTDVSWEDATAYASWAGKRLPTEEEWEYAARGSNDKNLLPWGEDWRDEAANVMKDENDKRQLAPVGQFPNGASPFGVLDMIGNAWEWTASSYNAYPGGQVEARPSYSNLKVIRGGSYESTAGKVTATLRRGWPGGRNDWPKGREPEYGQTGFRCAQDAKAQ